jgi:Mg2+ and Co2+ transporter CorA
MTVATLWRKINYDYLAAAIAEKINPAFGTANDVDIDTEELAKAISEKVSLNATVNEDAIADKAAAVLSNYLPEIDTDEIADKVVAGVIPAIPAAPVIDYDNISSSVSEKIVESQEDKDFDIVIDDEGLSRITESISGDIKDEYTRRFNELDGEVAQIKAALTDGSLTDKVAEETEKLDDRTEKLEEKIDKLEEKIEKQIEELKALILSGVVVRSSDEIAAAEADENEELVTVSDIVFEHQPAEELKGDEEQEDDEDDGDEVIDEIVDDIDESLSDGEIMPDGIPGISNGVDFASMMKYNRSFIARIIQGSDDVKQYYGEVKSALLSYKKVNSNIAWGAERFNKGRETIARFKIRGKTLCLYLALDPNEYKESVYHHSDVSDNKSMHGTPMMVKIKSPLGVKKAIRLIDEMLEKRNGIKQPVKSRDYAAMYPYESMEALIEDGLVKDVSKNK